jgi:hypothetical protein
VAGLVDGFLWMDFYVFGNPAVQVVGVQVLSFWFI